MLVNAFLYHIYALAWHCMILMQKKPMYDIILYFNQRGKEPTQSQ